ncbi:MAG: PQQ-dependent dehydrogenase, methanol/ethanol family [Steroidobacteraceae bacterium]
MTRSPAARKLANLACGLLFAVAATAAAAAATAGAANSPAAVDTARIVSANREPGNWMSVGRTYDEQRFSPLTQINEHNVKRLGLAWYYDLETFRGIEGTPVVVDGVMYLTSAWSIAYALDARTGQELWRYDPKVPPSWARFICCDVVSRGPAVYQGKVIIATLDGRLIALDARNGKPLWSILTVDNKNWPYSITGAPRVFSGKVIIGNAGVELGVRGYVSAYDVSTGKLIWRFWTVPGNPAQGPDGAASDPVMAKAAKTWFGNRWWLQGGGGAVWDSIVYDPELKRIYFGTGNGSPWPRKLRSAGKGDNLFLASIIAVDADTGRYIWHYQEVPGESWDFDVTQPLILADLAIGGTKRKVIMQAPKQGFFYVIDRTSGKLISTGKFIDHNTWASRIDAKTGRPVLLANADYDNEPRMITPNAVAAHSWQPMSYNPMTGLAYFPVLQNWYTYEIEPGYKPQKFRMSWGTNAPPSAKNAQVRADLAKTKTYGYLLAWDPVKQKEAWRVPYDRGGNGGTLTTAGNLVVEGTSDQELAIYRATDGKKLWATDVQTVPVAGAVSYSVQGVQYIAVEAGGASYTSPPKAHAAARVLVFRLGGNQHLPPITPRPSYPPPPSVAASEEVIRQGSVAYHRVCAPCHGRDAISVNAIPDLRHMAPGNPEEFKDIVLNGKLAAKGMASFSDLVTGADADAIYAYLMSRAREDWNN